MPKAEWRPAKITDEEEYKTGGNSDWISIDIGESFQGYLLGGMDPKVDDPAFYPYKVHWIEGRSVPCAGDNCPNCEDGDRPRAKALTLWVVTQNEKSDRIPDGELRVFDMPKTVIEQIDEYRHDGDKVKGQLWRVRRTDKTTYAVGYKTGTLKATEIKEYLSDPNAPDFEEFLTLKLRKAMEGTAVKRALEQSDTDDDDDVVERSARKKGRPEPEPEEDPVDEMPEQEDEGIVVTVTEVSDDNYMMVQYGDAEPVQMWGTEDVDVTDIPEGTDVTICYYTDDEGDLVLTADPEVEAGDPEENGDPKSELPEAIEGVEMTVTGVDTGEQTMEVQNEEHEFTLYFLDAGDAADIDFDDFKEGDKILVTAEKDNIGDMVATAVPEPVKAARKAAPKSGSTRKAAPRKAAPRKAVAKKATAKRTTKTASAKTKTQARSRKR